MIQKDFYRLSSESATNVNHHFDYYFKQMIRSTNSLTRNSVVQTWLTHKEARISSEDTVESELVRSIGNNYPEIVGMFLMSGDGDIVSSFGKFYSNPLYYQQEPWFHTPISPETKVLSTHRVNYPQQSQVPVLSLIIPVYSVSDIELCGRLIIDFNMSEIGSTFNSSNLGHNGFFFILSDDDTIVYHPNAEWLGLPRSQTEMVTLNLDNPNNTFIQSWHDGSWLVSKSSSYVTDWRIVAVTPFDEMAGGLKTARNATWFTFFVITLCILFVVPYVSARFVQPVIMLQNLMRRLAGGDLSVRAKINEGKDELQELNISFNTMVKQLKELNETVIELRVKEIKFMLRQKEAAIRVLQNQINPHLLYNSLELIKSIAYLEKTPKIELLARNLADVYRYNAKFADAEVTLRDEIQHLMNYLGIVKIRFSLYFQSNIYVHEKFLDCLCVKLTLQPIAENAVKYAVEPNGGDAAILVSAYNEDQDLIIEIADNGPGITEARLNDLTSQLAQITEHCDAEYVRNESLGITNVHARLVLKYGERYGIRLSSFGGKGTVVSIRIPFRVEQPNARKSSI
ncbi:cache domain-containing sensor histidine kinase [Paenibacillus thalictri]|uniref:cache domain-containing sensor histidine kinase n=1 Tax=Paenibacillus thalictri TaxID=2527873 RepID=UPI0013EF19FD|nr:cache domain-containing protein [Paenibacillus thalictri]